MNFESRDFDWLYVPVRSRVLDFVLFCELKVFYDRRIVFTPFCASCHFRMRSYFILFCLLESSDWTEGFFPSWLWPGRLPVFHSLSLGTCLFFGYGVFFRFTWLYLYLSTLKGNVSTILSLKCNKFRMGGDRGSGIFYLPYRVQFCHTRSARSLLPSCQ